ncbi:hypothetical protein FKM82_021346, partial [Ascaphus truei]
VRCADDIASCEGPSHPTHGALPQQVLSHLSIKREPGFNAQTKHSERAGGLDGVAGLDVSAASCCADRLPG